MKQNSYRITYNHTEGDGIFAVATGRASGTYTAYTHGQTSEREARECFEATHRHGDTIVSIEVIAQGC